MIFLFILVSLALFALLAAAIFLWINRDKGKLSEPQEYTPVQSFSASEYLERMEKVNLEILENQHKPDKILILWWGLDGLRLNEDGTLEWISRKKPTPKPCVFDSSLPTTSISCDTQSTMDRIQKLQMEAQNINIQAQNQILNQQLAMQMCCARPAYMGWTGGAGGGASFATLYPTYTDFICSMRSGTLPINI